jgi:hypothetical protein
MTILKFLLASKAPPEGSKVSAGVRLVIPALDLYYLKVRSAF